MKTLSVETRADWRSWLETHHASETEVWLVFHKRHTHVACLAYDDAVEEALCFGWVDSLVKRLDDARYARKFTPRKPDARWSDINRRRYEDLKARGLLAAPGIERGPTDRRYAAPDDGALKLTADLEAELRANRRAWENFERLAPSYKRTFVGWISTAKREETRRRRLREGIELLAAGKKLGLK
ncbi:MAG TPA: YdeI/OmpD-associated family protein [Gammaproteobacteria bacterium]|nr:YdeI/OmpD-associated family protein [Gammaproteobacteria bacterium]